jgi:hypothetical protein
MGITDQSRTLSRSRQCNSWMHAAPTGLSWKRYRAPEKFEVRLDQGEFTEGHELDRKWRVPKEMIGRRLSQEEAKRLLAKFE